MLIDVDFVKMYRFNIVHEKVHLHAIKLTLRQC